MHLTPNPSPTGRGVPSSRPTDFSPAEKSLLVFRFFTEGEKSGYREHITPPLLGEGKGVG
jgi:hypothetical protein